MYVDDCTYQRDDKTYRRVLLRNSYRVDGKVRHDTLANLSACSDEEINAIKFGLKNKQRLEELAPLSSTVSTEQGLAVGAVWSLFQLSKRLGLVRALGRSRNALLGLWLVFSTLIAQGSRLSSVRLARQHAVCDVLGLDGFNEEHLYQTLDWLSEHQEQIETQLFVQRGGSVGNLYLYDVTSSYLEGEQNELADWGYNRDKKKGKKQIVIGLLTDDEGCPVAVEVFRGNTSDPKTVQSQIDRLRKRFGVEHVTMVGDRGMIKSAQIEALDQEGFHFISAITKPQIEKLIHDGVMQLDLFDEQLTEIEHDGMRYVLRRNPQRAEELAKSREEKQQTLRKLIDDRNQYLAEHARAKPEVALNKVLAKAEKLKIQDGVVVTLEERTITATVDEAKKQDVARLDGCYVIKSNVPKKAADKQTLHDRYKDLGQVERAFRTMKTALLEMRPIFVRKANRTRAHVFVVMLAYYLAHRLAREWKDLDVTVEEGLAELSSICAVQVKVTNQARCQMIPTPRKLGQQLLERLNITLPDAIPGRAVVVATRKSLVSERK